MSSHEAGWAHAMRFAQAGEARMVYALDVARRDRNHWLIKLVRFQRREYLNGFILGLESKLKERTNSQAESTGP